VVTGVYLVPLGVAAVYGNVLALLLAVHWHHVTLV
jgi:hypothetical protein